MRISDWSSDVCSSDLSGTSASLPRRSSSGTSNGWCRPRPGMRAAIVPTRSEEHTSELQSLMRISYAVFCLKKKKRKDDREKLWYIRNKIDKRQGKQRSKQPQFTYNNKKEQTRD